MRQILLFIIIALSVLYSNLIQSSCADKGDNKQQLSIQLNEQGIEAVRAEKFTEAEALFKKSLLVDSGNITAAFNLAGMLLNNKRIDEAIEILKRYMKAYPNDVGLYVRLGDCYFAKKQLDEALLTYEKAFKIDPNYTALLSKLGTIYGLKGQLKKSEEMYFRAVQQNPKDVRSLENLSVLLIANSKAEQAIPLIKSALRLDSSAHLYRLLGQSYQIIGDKENQEIAFKRANELETPINKQP